MMMSPRRGRARGGASAMTDRELGRQIAQQSRCAGSRVDPDEWFPCTMEVAKARHEAARAIAVCITCPVRADCLEFSLRHAYDVGAYGIWGGLVEQERKLLRRKWLAGTSVTELL